MNQIVFGREEHRRRIQAQRVHHKVPDCDQLGSQWIRVGIHSQTQSLNPTMVSCS